MRKYLIPDTVLKAVNRIGGHYLQHWDEPTYWQSNACLYAQASIVKQYINYIQKVNGTEITENISGF